MKLYCMRHGEAENPGINPERPLTANGKAELKRLAEHLKKNHIRFPTMVHSPRLRARQTAEALAELVDHDRIMESHCGLDQTCYLGEAMELIEETNEDLLIVAHMPFIAELVCKLTTDQTKYPLLQFLPGTIVCLEPMIKPFWHINWVLHASVV